MPAPVAVSTSTSTSIDTAPVDAPAATQPSADAKVQIRLSTRQRKWAVSETPLPLLLPARLTRSGLNEVVRALLAERLRGASTDVQFDFLIVGELLRSSLQAYLDKKGLSTVG
jgi:ribosome biogenesis protein YTM1